MPYSDQNVGWQRTDTSAQAALDFGKKAPALRTQILDLLRAYPAGLNAEAIAQLLRKPYGSVQPRTSELRNEGKIIDSGRREISSWGKRIIVWQLAR